jgi:phosphatidylglycerophosphatase A
VCGLERMSVCERALASGFFSGYAPIAPGTAGSLVAVALLWLLSPSSGYRGAPAAGGLAVGILVLLMGGCWLASRAEKEWGKDSKRVVVDEFLGQAIAVAFLPKEPMVWLVAFLIFRGLDVLKPFPARRAERLPGGAGVMADDIVAGVYANACVQLLRVAGL